MEGAEKEYLRVLQTIEMNMDTAKLRDIFEQYQIYSDRLPKLNQDMNELLEPELGKRYDLIIASSKKNLIKVASLVSEIDDIPKCFSDEYDVQCFIEDAFLKVGINNTHYYKGKLNKLLSEIEQRKADQEESDLRYKKISRGEEVQSSSLKSAYLYSSLLVPLLFIVVVGALLTIFELLSDYPDVVGTWVGVIILSVPVLLFSLLIFRLGSSCVSWTSDTYADSQYCEFNERGIVYEMNDIGDSIAKWFFILYVFIIIAIISIGVFSDLNKMKLYFSNNDILFIMKDIVISLFVIVVSSSIFLAILGGVAEFLLGILTSVINKFLKYTYFLVLQVCIGVIEESTPVPTATDREY